MWVTREMILIVIQQFGTYISERQNSDWYSTKIVRAPTSRPSCVRRIIKTPKSGRLLPYKPYTGTLPTYYQTNSVYPCRWWIRGKIYRQNSCGRSYNTHEEKVQAHYRLEWNDILQNVPQMRRQQTSSRSITPNYVANALKRFQHPPPKHSLHLWLPPKYGHKQHLTCEQ